jgi:hypothetical protein
VQEPISLDAHRQAVSTTLPEMVGALQHDLGISVAASPGMNRILQPWHGA